MSFTKGATAPNNTWTAERTERLRVLIGKGYSATQIARNLGGITRNAVIGKAVRLGLQLGMGTAQAPGVGRLVAFSPPGTSRGKPRTDQPKDKVVKLPPAVVRLETRFGDNGHAYQTPAASPPAKELPHGGVKGLELLISDPGFCGCRWPRQGDGAEQRFCCMPTGNDGADTYCATHDRIAHPAAKTLARHSTKELIRSVRRYA